MRTILIMVWANIKDKKLQSIALGLVFIAVSILFFLSIRLFGTTGAYEQLYIESKTSQGLIYVSGEDSKDIIVNYLERNEEILNVSVLANYDDIIETNFKQGEELTPVPDAFLTEIPTGEFDQIKIIEGKTTEQLLENEVIFSYGKSKLSNISLGDSIIVSTESGTTELTIAGIGVDLTFNFDTITLNRFWTTLETIEQFNTVEKNYSIGISYVDYNKDTEEQILDEIQLALGDNASDTLILTHQLIIQANSFFQIVMGAIFTLIGVILIVVGLFIIRSIVYNNIITESKRIATLKSTGFSSNNIISMYVVEYGVIACISILFGIFGSIFLSDVVLSDLNELSNMFGLTTGFNIPQMIMLFIIIIGIIQITVYIVAKRVSKINPAVALTRGVQVNETEAVVSVIKHHKMPLTLALALKDILYNKKLIITLILFIIATSFTIVTLSSASYSLNNQKSNNELWLGYDIDAKVISATPLDLEGHQNIISDLESSDYVLGTVTVYNDFKSQIYDDTEEKYITAISQIFVTEDKAPLSFNVLDGRIPENENEIMLANNLLTSLHKELGDFVTVRSLGEEMELLIVGECQSMTNQGMTFRLFKEDMQEEYLNSSLIQVNFVDGYEEAELTTEIERIFGDDMTVVFEYTNASMVSMLDILSVVTSGVIGIFAVICLVVLLNLNLTNINKERFNYGIYKSIGMNNRNIINIYLYKNSIVNIIGIFIGGLTSVLVLPTIMNAMTSSLGITDFPTEINYISFIITIAIVFGVTLLNAIIINHTIAKISPKDLLIE